MTIPIPSVPWQVTGNHWISLPCIHPADASIHLVGTVNARLRGAVEFAGDGRYLEGSANPLIRIVLEVTGERVNNRGVGQRALKFGNLGVRPCQVTA